MAVAIREFLFSGSNTANCTAALGAGSAIGDVVFVVHGDDFYTAAAMTAPTATGLTFTQQGTTVDVGSNNCHVKVWSTTLVAGGAQTITCHSTNVDQERYMATFVLTGANAAADAVGGTGASTSTTTLTLPAISPTSSTDLLIGCWECVSNGAAQTFSSFTNGMVQQGSAVNITSHTADAVVATKTLSASGTTGSCAVTIQFGAIWAGVLVAVSASSVAATSVPRTPKRGPNYRR